jgi:hypothetical protein
MRSKLTKQDVQDALINTRITIRTLENSTNPQTQEIVLTAKGREAAFEAVLLALRGDTSLLHIYSQNDKYDKPVL